MADVTMQGAVQDYVGTVSDTDALRKWLTAGARQLIDKLPREKLLMLSSDNTDSGAGVSLTSKRFIRAHKSDVGTFEVEPSLKAHVQNTSSQHYATTDSPVHLFDDAKVFVYPGGGTVVAASYPSVDYSNTSITGFPQEMEQLVVLYAAIQAAMGKLGAEAVVLDALSLGTLTTNINGVTWAVAYPNQYSAITTSLAGIVTALGQANAGLSNSATAVDTDVDTALGLVNTAVDRMNTAVTLANTEFDKIAAEINSADTTISTNEDIELGTAELGIADGRLKNGNAYLSEAQASLAEAQGYIGEVSARMQQVQGYDTVVSGYLKTAQTFINEVQTRLGNLQAEIAEYQTRVSKEINEYTLNIQKSTSTIQSWRVLIESLEKQYENLLRMYL